METVSLDLDSSQILEEGSMELLGSLEKMFKEWLTWNGKSLSTLDEFGRCRSEGVYYLWEV